MKKIDIRNPYGAPVYYCESVVSTMDTARILAAQDEPGGTVITADFQEKGRGRQGRQWIDEKGRSLLFTVLLKYPDLVSVPKAITLRAGLAAALAVEDFIPELSGSVMVKWPNDLMLVHPQTGNAGKGRPACKTAGILAEYDGSAVFLGMGVNLSQRNFPPELQKKAGSLLSFYTEEFPGSEIPKFLSDGSAAFVLLEKILSRFYAEFQDPAPDLRGRLESRLYMRGKPVVFAEGAADSRNLVSGILSGVNDEGGLLIVPDGESKARVFVNGELKFPSG